MNEKRLCMVCGEKMIMPISMVVGDGDRVCGIVCARQYHADKRVIEENVKEVPQLEFLLT